MLEPVGEGFVPPDRLIFRVNDICHAVDNVSVLHIRSPRVPVSGLAFADAFILKQLQDVLRDLLRR